MWWEYIVPNFYDSMSDMLILGIISKDGEFDKTYNPKKQKMMVSYRVLDSRVPLLLDGYNGEI